MLKKPELMLLLSITILFIGILIGVLLGRQSSNNEIRLSDNETTHSMQAQPLQTESDLSGKLDINKVTAEELAMLPGIGQSYAQRIVEYRQNNGPFLAVEDLLNVEGIGPKRFESISKYITVGG